MGHHLVGYPKSWLFYNGKSHLEILYIDDLGVPPFQETLKYAFHRPNMVIHVMKCDLVKISPATK